MMINISAMCTIFCFDMIVCNIFMQTLCKYVFDCFSTLFLRLCCFERCISCLMCLIIKVGIHNIEIRNMDRKDTTNMKEEKN